MKHSNPILNFGNIFSCLLVILAVAVQSCQKEASVDTVQPPTDTTQQTGGDSSFLPRSIAILSPDDDDESLTISFQYLPDQRQIKYYVDDTTTANPYDRLALTYFYNSAGYFMKREGYDEAGQVSESFSVERRSDNTPKTVMAWSKDDLPGQTLRDTFAVSFADSTGAPSYKIMTVNNSYRSQVNANGDYVTLQASTRLTFQNNRVITERQQRFDERDASMETYNRSFTYDALGRLSTEKPDWYYGTAYTYENTGRSLDSFAHVIGGKDGYLFDIEGLWSYDAQAEFSYFPFFIILANNQVELYAQIHKYGILKQVKSIPNGADFPNTEAFDFKNTFDDKQRVTQTTITSNGSLYATWKIKY